MNVQTLLSELSYGPLSNLSLAGDGDGVIRDSAKPKVIIGANEGLLRLYTRYLLKENDLLIELVDHITNYHLLPQFAESSWETSTQTTLYIKDLMREPFLGDVVKVLEVVDSYGYTLPLNDPDRPDSVFTPQGNVLQVPNPVAGVALALRYQARHVPLDADMPTQPIELPDVLWAALKSYTAYQVYSQINTQEALAIAQGHLMAYEAVCQEVQQQDLVSTSLSSTSTRFQKRGWK